MSAPLPPEPPSDRSRAGREEDLPGPDLPGSVQVPSDPSALDGLPPYEPRALPPVPRGVLGDPGSRGSVPLGGRPGSDPHSADPYGDGRGTPLDLSKDPDRFGSDAYEEPAAPPPFTGRLDPALDPDRMPTGLPGEGRTLAELLGDGAHEGERNGYEWVLGLLAVLVFLALVAFVAGQLGP